AALGGAAAHRPARARRRAIARVAAERHDRFRPFVRAVAWRLSTALAARSRIDQNPTPTRGSTMNLSLRAMILSTVLLFAATACRQDRIMAPDAGRADPTMLENYPQIVVLDDLGDYVVFAAPNVRAGDQPMSVSVPIRLQSDREVNLQYRFEFF